MGEEKETAWLIFPLEVWEIILEKLDKYQDISNAFKAFPELERVAVLKRKMYLYLFDQVIPNLFPFLKQKELLSCRRVCKKWSRGVDNFLENHPDKMAYNPGPVTNCPNNFIQVQEASQSHRVLWEHFSGLKTFANSQMFKEFNRDMGQYDHDHIRRNPFVGRSVHIHAGYPDSNDDDLQTFRHSALEFLRKFGRHIWFLEISSHLVEDSPQISQLLLDSVSLVPNLKGLNIWIPSSSENGDEDEDIDQVWDQSASGETFSPNLSHLETLEVVYNQLPLNLVHMLVNGSAAELRRLDINFRYWRLEYSTSFPKLTELALTDVHSEEELQDLLHSLHSPGLTKLELEVTDPNFVIDGHLLSWLIKFPNLHSFHLEMLNIQVQCNETTSLQPGRVIIPSITSLTLSADSKLFQMDFHFFKHFPSLEYLKIVDGREQTYFDRINLYEVDVWVMLPKLREITLRVWDYKGRGRHYTRAKYEYFKRI